MEKARSRARPRRRPRNIQGKVEAHNYEENEDKRQIEMRMYFDHERLDVYQLELSFVTWVTGVLATIKQRPTNARVAEVSDQLDRASLSILLNTAEGNGRRQPEEEFEREDEDENENGTAHSNAL